MEYINHPGNGIHKYALFFCARFGLLDLGVDKGQALYEEHLWELDVLALTGDEFIIEK